MSLDILINFIEQNSVFKISLNDGLLLAREKAGKRHFVVSMIVFDLKNSYPSSDLVIIVFCYNWSEILAVICKHGNKHLQYSFLL